MEAYSSPWTNLDRKRYLRLDLSENTQAPPECVNDALKRLIDDGCLQMYPDYREFLPRLSRYVEVDQDRVIITNGSDQAIHIILRAYLRENDGMLIAQPEFPIFSKAAKTIGVRIQGVPYNRDLGFPYEAFAKAITQETRLVVLINPNNPTGSPIALEEIQSIIELASDIPVVVDEAYFEFTGITCRHLLDTHPNLIIIRTFSKVFAMAGLRLGYILAAPDIIAQFYKVRPPYDVNACALVAAQAQIDHPADWKKYIHEAMTISKPLVEKFFMENSVHYYPGAAHFMLVRPKNRDSAVEYLKKHGILVFPMKAHPIQETFRMSVGTPAETQRFIDVYSEFLQN